MKALVISLLLLLIAAPGFASEDCEPAVEAADSMNVNQKDCDYSNEGLNGFLQKAFKKGDKNIDPDAKGNDISVDAAATNHEKSLAPAAKAPALTANTIQAANDRQFVLDIEVDQWANLTFARAQLLPKAMERCGRAFSVIKEQYRSLAMGRIALGLYIECEN
jgi:hypothetical protein